MTEYLSVLLLFEITQDTRKMNVIIKTINIIFVCVGVVFI